MADILFEKKDKIGILTINRPEKRNSISPDMFLTIESILNKLIYADDIRVIIIRGCDNKMFSSGYDISTIPTEKEEVSEIISKKNPLEKGMRSILNFPYPIIAMLNGHAIGAGCELSLCCDIRIAREDIRMGMPPAKLGVLYLPNGLKRFAQLIGISNAKEMFFTGRLYEKERLKELGLVHYLVKREEIEKFTFDMANEIATNAPLSLKGTKRMLNILTKTPDLIGDELNESMNLIYEAYCSDDLKEGRKAFSEKRKPNFIGK
jgi:enoyl-CoA hydratase/carnithine racemase